MVMMSKKCTKKPSVIQNENDKVRVAISSMYTRPTLKQCCYKWYLIDSHLQPLHGYCARLSNHPWMSKCKHLSFRKYVWSRRNTIYLQWIFLKLLLNIDSIYRQQQQYSIYMNNIYKRNVHQKMSKNYIFRTF